MKTRVRLALILWICAVVAICACVGYRGGVLAACQVVLAAASASAATIFWFTLDRLAIARQLIRPRQTPDDLQRMIRLWS